MPKILFLTTAHRFDDDRIFYHQAMSLKEEGFGVKICSLCSDTVKETCGIEIESYALLNQSAKTKIRQFVNVCAAYSPDCIIASEPLAVIAAAEYRKTNKKIKILYDITEWYPSFRMLQPYPAWLKPSYASGFLLVQFWAGFCSSGFIFGEDSKKFPLKYIFPFKKSVDIPYYPDERYIVPKINKLVSDKITLCYTGRISKEDGIGNFLKASALLQKKNPELKVLLLIIGKPKRKEDEAYFDALRQQYSNLNISLKNPVPFPEFSASFQDADICFDLRENNTEYSKSLPIKLFYYAASGKPVVYTDLKAIRKHMDISGFGNLVDPENEEQIVRIIENYLKHPDLYRKKAENARKSFEDKFNWNLIKKNFIDFVKQNIPQ